MIGTSVVVLRALAVPLVLTFAAGIPAIASLTGSAPGIAATTAAPQPAQTFATPEAAVAALVAALRQNDRLALRAVLGPGADALIWSGDEVVDAEARKLFVTAYDAKHALAPDALGRMVLSVGEDDWPLPIPLVSSGQTWHFDSQLGAQELVERRIGRDEIAAIRTALAYTDAQKAYFQMTSERGPGEYAQRMVSTPGRHDGLYWPAAEGQPDSPLQPLVDQAVEEGYPGASTSGKPAPYQGYYFRILTAQGDDAPGGALDYVTDGHMTKGFALIAWPASYGSSGIMTFQVNQDGIVFQKDLGQNTARLASDIKRFDPDLSWIRVDVVNQ